MRELVRLKDLARYRLHAADGDIGHVHQVLFDDRNWEVRYIVVRTGSWLFGRDVLLLPDMISDLDHDEQRIDTELSRRQIKDAPTIEERLPVSLHYEQQFHLHYDWDPYWGVDPLFGIGSAPPPAIDDAKVEEPVNPHLRSSEEVTGYRVGAEEGDVGDVRDLVIEVPGWRVRYVDVATGSWLFGKEVLIACAWLESVDWTAQRVDTVLTRAAIESAPPYDAGKVISRDDEVALYKHYGQHFEDSD